MKKYLYSSFILFGIITTLYSCTKESKSVQNTKVEQVVDANASTFVLDTSLSNIDWTGYKVFKSENTSHFGTMKFSEGKIGVKDYKIISGEFIADITSLKNTDLADDHTLSEKLELHLKSTEFFNAENFPTATFSITKVIPVEQGDYNSILEGNITIKNITKPISFNANIKIDNEQVSISTEPTDIDRSLFDIKFQSPIENGIVKNNFSLQIVVKARLNQ